MSDQSVIRTSNELSKVEECREAFEKYLGPKAQLRKHNGYYDAPLIETAWNDFQAGWLASRSDETGVVLSPQERHAVHNALQFFEEYRKGYTPFIDPTMVALLKRLDEAHELKASE